MHDSDNGEEPRVRPDTEEDMPFPESGFPQPSNGLEKKARAL